MAKPSSAMEGYGDLEQSTEVDPALISYGGWLAEHRPIAEQVPSPSKGIPQQKYNLTIHLWSHVICHLLESLRMPPNPSPRRRGTRVPASGKSPAVATCG
ncbi:hypothetical protein FKP32DRAFT_1670608 [Trametes sanguinea]|nr:hypothetical protein FKP32DRAFT_1670608 [Trametes sanguinea]